MELSDCHPARIELLLDSREFGEGIKLLPLVQCGGVAVNEVHDWSGIHHRFSKQSFSAGQVNCAVCEPDAGLRACGEGLDINGSRTVANEDH